MSSLKRFIHRQKEGLAERFGKAEKTVDEEYDYRYRRFDQIATASVNYNKHVQQFVENFHAMSTTLTFLAEDLTDLYRNSSDQNKIIMADKIMQVAQDIETTAVRPFQDQVVSQVVNPLNSYIAKFDEIKKLHKQRSQTLQEFDYYKTKVKKLMEKQSKDPMKLPQNKEKYNRLKEDLDAINATTKAKFEEIIEEQPIVFEDITRITVTSLLEYWERVNAGLVTLRSWSTQLDYPSSTVGNSNTFSKQQSFSKPFASKSVQEYTSVNLQPLPTLKQTTSVKKVELPPKFNCDWYYLDSGMNQTGPIPYIILKEKYSSREINDQTYVYGPTELTDWKAIGDYTDLKQCLADISFS
jgi:hypothetical protein